MPRVLHNAATMDMTGKGAAADDIAAVARKANPETRSAAAVTENAARADADPHPGAKIDERKEDPATVAPPGLPESN